MTDSVIHMNDVSQIGEIFDKIYDFFLLNRVNMKKKPV